VVHTDGAIVSGKACTEIEVQGMPNHSGTGYADYVLFGADGLPLAVIEAKKTSVDEAVGRQQAELYADCLMKKYHCPRPVIYYTNGFKIKIIDGLGYPPRDLMGYHTAKELQLMITQRGRSAITDLTIDDNITDRTYQKRVITSVCKHFNKMHRRALLVMATGTGKTRVSISWWM
jgi:type I restriction enzyme R subunit